DRLTRHRPRSAASPTAAATAAAPPAAAPTTTTAAAPTATACTGLESRSHPVRVEADLFREFAGSSVQRPVADQTGAGLCWHAAWKRREEECGSQQGRPAKHGHVTSVAPNG